MIRKKLYREYKFENLITPADTIAYGKSTHVQTTRAWMEKLGEETSKQKEELPKRKIWDARDFLVMIIVLINACR